MTFQILNFKFSKRAEELIFFLTFIFTIATPFFVMADEGNEEKEWYISGSNEAQLDYYNVNGDKSASPYQDEGVFWSNRLDLSLGKSAKPGQLIGLQLEAVGSNDPYRLEDGAVLERAQFIFEDGTVNIPYRLYAGDLFASLSRRTIQRTIRGVYFELQPQNLSFGNQSILFLSGTGEVEWDKTFSGEGDDLYFNGASYLFTSKSQKTTFGVNLVHTLLQDTAVENLAPVGLSRDQIIYSLMGETTFKTILIEGEYAFLNSLVEGSNANDSSGAGGYFQASGQKGPFSARFRFEQNDMDFIPAGGSLIISNRRSFELMGGYRLSFPGNINIRLQNFRDNLEGPIPGLDTNVLGLSYQGILTAIRPTMQTMLSWSVNEIEAVDKSTDEFFTDYAFFLSDSFGKGFYSLYSFNFSKYRDNNISSLTANLMKNTLSLGKRFGGELFGSSFNFDINVGLEHSRQYINAEYSSIQPLIDFSVRNENHSLDLHYSFQDQEYTNPTVSDLQNQSRRLTYSYTQGPHIVSVRWLEDLHRPGNATRTDSQKFTLSYNYAFDN